MQEHSVSTEPLETVNKLEISNALALLYKIDQSVRWEEYFHDYPEARPRNPGMMEPSEIADAIRKELPAKARTLREIGRTHSKPDDDRQVLIEYLSMEISKLGDCGYFDGETWHFKKLLHPPCHGNLINIRELFVVMLSYAMEYGNVIKSIQQWHTEMKEMNKQESETLHQIKNFFIDGGKEALQLIKNLEDLLEKFTRNEISHSALSKSVKEEAMLDRLKGLNDDFMHNISSFINATKEVLTESKMNHHKRYWNTILALYQLASIVPGGDRINSRYPRVAREMSIWRQPKPMTQRNVVSSSCMHKPQY
jgi:hypothetical protein